MARELVSEWRLGLSLGTEQHIIRQRISTGVYPAVLRALSRGTVSRRRELDLKGREEMEEEAGRLQ